MINFFRKKPKIKGYVGYLRLEDVWLSLTDQQQEEVKKRYAMGLGTDPDMLADKEIRGVSEGMTKTHLLTLMAEGIKDIPTKKRLLEQAFKELVQKKATNRHFELMAIWKEYKKVAKEDEAAYPFLVKVLKEDVQLHNEFNIGWKKQFDDVLPSYPAFKEMALAYERMGEYQKAIDISRDAIEKEVIESTSFERRIAKLERKIE